MAFTEYQIRSVLRVVADETASASYDILENLIQRASQLSIGSSPTQKKTIKRSGAKRSAGSSAMDERSSGL